MKNILIILFISTSLFAQAQPSSRPKAKSVAKKSFTQKYQSAVVKEVKKLSVSEKINALLSIKLKDYQKSTSTLKGIKVEMVQFFGKKERNYIYKSLQVLALLSTPVVTVNKGAFYIKVKQTTIKMQLVSLLDQKFIINEGLTLDLKNIKSFRSYLKFVIPKLNIIIHANNSFSLIKKAYAIEGAENLAFSIMLLMINTIHGRTKSCDEALDVYLEEFKDTEQNCIQENRNFNPSNMDSIKNLSIGWREMKQEINITNQIGYCKSVARYLENENSIQCSYEKDFDKSHDICKSLNRIQACIEALEEKVISITPGQ
jgi:hypothetical protein